MHAHKHTRQTIVRLLSSMGSAKEIQQYLKRFAQLDAKRFAVVKVGGAVIRDELADVSVVEALRKEGIDILTSCEQGVCGTCLTRVLEGEVDHRDMYLTDEEKAANEQFMPCCSRARSKLLVLDL